MKVMEKEKEKESILAEQTSTPSLQSSACAHINNPK
jgi:hypothetical protein